MKKLHDDAGGYIVIEATVSFILYLFLIVFILSLVGVVAIQARVHNAITQAATSISMYTYVLDLTGASNTIMGKAEEAESVYDDINTFNDELNNLISSLNDLDVEGAKGSADYFMELGNGAAADPKAALDYLLNSAVNVGINEGKNLVFSEAVLSPIVERYLSIGNITGKQYLSNVSINDGLGFYDELNKGSTFLNSEGEVRIVVEYDIDYTLGLLMLPFDDNKLHIKQTVLTKAWLGGNGEGYVHDE